MNCTLTNATLLELNVLEDPQFMIKKSILSGFGEFYSSIICIWVYICTFNSMLCCYMSNTYPQLCMLIHCVLLCSLLHLSFMHKMFCTCVVGSNVRLASHCHFHHLPLHPHLQQFTFGCLQRQLVKSIIQGLIPSETHHNEDRVGRRRSKTLNLNW